MGTAITLAFTALDSLIRLLANFRKNGKQTGEWTEQHEKDFQARRQQITSQDHWQVD